MPPESLPASSWPEPSSPAETRHTAESEKRVESNQANIASESPGIFLPYEILSLIIDFVSDNGENKRDLFGLCLVSKIINSLATPRLYRSVPISPVNCPGTTWVKRNAFPLLERPSKLVRRLLRGERFDASSLVRELRIESRFDVEGETAMEVTRKSVLRFISQDCLARLVNCLPNLERIRLEFPLPLNEKLAENLESHRNNIDIQLIWSEVYHGSIPRRIWPSITAVRAMIGCSGLDDKLLELLQSCNNLRSFSVQHVNQSLVVDQSLCSPEPIPRLNQWMSPLFAILNYRSLYGYNTWYLWEEQSPWSSLVSLTIDSVMGDCDGILGAISGRTPRLENLKLAFDIKKRTIAAVEQFMASFNTLKSFECIGWCSLRNLSSHIRLLSLKMHVDEHTTHPEVWREAPRLNKMELEELSVACPDLCSLELDFQLEDGELPWDVIISLATQFGSLHSLTLDIEITHKAPLKSGQLILDSLDAQSIGEVFYKHKWKEFGGSSSLSGFQKLVLNVRCQLMPQRPAQQSPGPQWFEPERPDQEKPEQDPSLFVGTFEMKSPADPTHNPQVTILEPELREIVQGKGLEVTRQRFKHFS